MIKHAFQLLDKATGKRTDVLCTSREEFAKILSKHYVVPEDRDHVYVISLADIEEATDDEGKSFLDVNFSTAPLMLVSTFISQFGV